MIGSFGQTCRRKNFKGKKHRIQPKTLTSSKRHAIVSDNAHQCEAGIRWNTVHEVASRHRISAMERNQRHTQEMQA